MKYFHKWGIRFFPCRNITWKRQNTVPRDSLLNLPSSKDLAHSVRPRCPGLGNPRRQGGGSVLFTNEGNDLMFGSHVFVFTSKTLYSLIFVFTNKIIESLLYIVFTNQMHWLSLPIFVHKWMKIIESLICIVLTNDWVFQVVSPNKKPLSSIVVFANKIVFIF